MARRKKKVKKPGMIARGWQKFEAFLGCDLYYCPHGLGRFCEKCREWALERRLAGTGIENSKELARAILGLGSPSEVEPELQDDALETEVEETRESAQSPDRSSSPQPRPESEEEEETCPACSSVKIVGGLCPMCGHQTGDEVPYDEPETVEDVEEEDVE